jgi:hypothetical protein
MDLTLLQHRLDEARRQQQQQQPPSGQASYRKRTAALDDANKLLRSELFTTDEVSYFLGISKQAVASEKARIEERERAKRKFLATGNLDFSEGGYVAIVPK